MPATATSAIIGVVEMTLRFEIFPDDLDATVDFYMRVLRFRLIADRRDEPSPYVSLQRGSVRVGAARRAVPDARAARRPPAGVELVLEVETSWPSATRSQRRDGRSPRISVTARGA
jgi:hypothetical protein